MNKIGHRTRQVAYKVLYWFTISTKKVSLSCGNQNGFFDNLIVAPPKLKI